jgi:alkanesulfonate monooxygenase SsuD/methylene tetrahydromethanopterin reductase-like flavin-dependent oxidoreductase (luciferase family)
VARALPDDPVTDASATGRTREVLSQAVRDYALVGTPETVGERVAALREAGVDTVVGYPARGIEEFVPVGQRPAASDD